MDYEKAYKEALERANSFQEKYGGDYAGYIFPDLRESEDEKIRKALIWHLKAGEDFVSNGVTKAECLAYLEKQKEPDLTEEVKKWKKDFDRLRKEHYEQKSSVWESPIMTNEMIMEKQKEPHYTKRNALFDKCVENCDPEIMKRVSDDVDEMLQKEQKPILEVFGFKVGDAVRLKDGDGRKHIIKSFEEVEGVHGPNFYHVEFEDSARSGIYPGEEYPSGYYTQMEKFEEEPKPIQTDAEKEYVRTLKSLVADFVRANNYIERGYYQQIYDWLDGRRVEQKEQKPVVTHGETYHVDTLGTQQVIAGKMPQKPAEWSEEDEKIITRLIGYFESFRIAGVATKWEGLDIQEVITLLKSLRPQGSKDSLQTRWKPSEEQMEAFRSYIKDFQEKAEAAVGGWNNFDVMIRLYEQLKKL